MICPKCETTEGIKWFLRHQDTETSGVDDANVITILCTECGHNESYFLENSLELIFPSWSVYFHMLQKQKQQQLMLDNLQEMPVDDFEVENNDSEIEEEQSD